MSLLPWGSIIVSCQAGPDSPLHGPVFMGAMAQAAELGGAAGFRVEGPEDVAAVREVTKLPVIGIKKHKRDAGGVFITPGFADAQAVAAAGADIVALDATDRPRPGDQPLSELVARIHDELGLPVLGDVDSVRSAHFAHAAGVDALATTLAGYTGGPAQTDPDLDLLDQLVRLDLGPVVAEGRITRAEHVEAAFERGALAVVIGKAITDPAAITRTFVDRSPSAGW